MQQKVIANNDDNTGQKKQHETDGGGHENGDAESKQWKKQIHVGEEVLDFGFPAVAY
jgi:hypothetical protein